MRNVTKSLLLFLFIFLCVSSVSAALTDGLISYYNFTSNGNDILGRNDLIVIGATFANGKVGNAGYFDASGDRIQKLTGTILPFNVSTTGLTQCAWTNNTNVNGSYYRAILLTSASNTNYAFQYRFDIGNNLAMWTVGAGTEKILNSTIKTGNNSWNFVCGIWNSSGQFVYKNGVLVNNQSFSGATFQPTQIQLGQDQYNTGEQFLGMLDEYGIWNRTLSSSEISILYNNGNGMSYPFINITFSNSSILPYNAYNNSVLTGQCTINGSNNVALNYSWYKNGVLSAYGDYPNKTINVSCFNNSCVNTSVAYGFDNGYIFEGPINITTNGTNVSIGLLTRNVGITSNATIGICKDSNNDLICDYGNDNFSTCQINNSINGYTNCTLSNINISSSAYLFKQVGQDTNFLFGLNNNVSADWTYSINSSIQPLKFNNITKYWNLGRNSPSNFSDYMNQDFQYRYISGTSIINMTMRPAGYCFSGNRPTWDNGNECLSISLNFANVSSSGAFSEHMIFYGFSTAYDHDLDILFMPTNISYNSNLSIVVQFFEITGNPGTYIINLTLANGTETTLYTNSSVVNTTLNYTFNLLMSPGDSIEYIIKATGIPATGFAGGFYTNITNLNTTYSLNTYPSAFKVSVTTPVYNLSNNTIYNISTFTNFVSTDNITLQCAGQNASYADLSPLNSSVKRILYDQLYPLFFGFIGNSPLNNSYTQNSTITLNANISSLNFNNLSITFGGTSTLVNTTQNSNGTYNVSSVTNTFTSNGLYNYSLSLYDSIGNANTSGPYYITFDTRTPIFTGFVGDTPANNSYLSRRNFTVNVGLNDSNFNNFTVYLYNRTSGLLLQTVVNSTQSANGTYNVSSANFSNLSDGSYYYNLTIYDKAGNNITIDPNVTIDLTAPTLSGFVDNESVSSPQIGEYIQLNITATDNLAGLYLCNLQTNDTGTWSNASYNTSLNGSLSSLVSFNYLIPSWARNANRTVSYSLWCNDSAGNYINGYASGLNGSFIVKDNGYPTITVTGNINSSNTSVITGLFNNSVFNVTYSDDNLVSANTTIVCDVDGTIYTKTNTSAYGPQSVIVVDQAVNYNPQTCYLYNNASDADGHLTRLDYIFYIGAAIRIRGNNLYNNASFINNITAIITTNNSYPGFTGTQYINSSNMYITGLSNGTYDIVLDSPLFLGVDYPIIYTNVSNQSINFSTSQVILNLQTVGLSNSVPYTGINYTVRNLLVSDLTTNATNTTTNITTFYLNASTYNISAFTQSGGNNSNATEILTLSAKTVVNYDLGVSFVATFHFVDEKTLAPFNMSAPNNITFIAACYDRSSYQTIINITQYSLTNSTTIPILCNYSYFSFIVEFNTTTGTTTYNRNFMLSIAEATNNSIYLINLYTTNPIFNNFVLDDLLKTYNNASIRISKFVQNGTVQITASPIDATNSIIAYLIENNPYIIEVYSSNMPVLYIGSYQAAVPGQQVLSVYQVVSDASGETVSGNTQSHLKSINTSQYGGDGDLLGYASYQDIYNQTYNVTVNFYNSTMLASPFYSILVPNQSFQLYTNISAYQNQRVYAEIIVKNSAYSYNRTELIYEPMGWNLEIWTWIDHDTMNWILLILISVIAIYATIRTAHYVGILVVGVAGLFAMVGWFWISVSTLVFAAIIAFIELLKKGDMSE